MKLNTKILKGLSEAKTVDDSELWLKNLEKIIKKVNFNGLASVSRLEYGDGPETRNDEGVKISNKDPKGVDREWAYAKFIISMIIYRTPTAENYEKLTSARLDGKQTPEIEFTSNFKIALGFGLVQEPYTYLKSEFTEEELLKKLKEFKQILKEVPGYQKSIVARLSK